MMKQQSLDAMYSKSKGNPSVVPTKRRKVDKITVSTKEDASAFASISRTSSGLRRASKQSTFQDPIHGHITMPSLCVMIINTTQFQRLHHLKQLGVCDFVYRGATHTRFEHSLGVAHIAYRLAKRLSEAQPELEITEVDRLCVMVAGLCHDLGHGPFSHVFEVALRRMEPTEWKHEQNSIDLFRMLIEQNGIDLEEHGLDKQDQAFIEELILGADLPGGIAARRGRGADKEFLYDIVNNVNSGLDVDKMDYFMRDAKASIGNNVTLDRFIELARVCEVVDPSAASNTRRTICYPEKLVVEAVEFFRLRYTMHEKVYTHKMVKAVEYMLTDALLHAKDDLKISVCDSDGNVKGQYSIVESVNKPEAFSYLNDSVLDLLRNSTDQSPGMVKARQLIYRINNRDLYKFIGAAVVSSLEGYLWALSEEAIRDAIIEQCSFEINGGAGVCVPDSESDENPDMLSQKYTPLKGRSERRFRPDVLTKDDLIVEKWHIHHGMKEIRETTAHSARSNAAHPGEVELQVNDTILVTAYMSDDYLIGKNLRTKESGKVHRHSVEEPRIRQSANPVDRMRFFVKNDDPEGNGLIRAHRVDDDKYGHVLPRCFEARKIRLWCRDPTKVPAATKAFNRWVRDVAGCPSPIGQCSQDRCW